MSEACGIGHPNGAGYGYIQYKYVEQYGSAYTTTVPTLDNGGGGGGNGGGGSGGGGGGPTTSCDYKCADYSFSANECYQGWQCDAQGQCLSYTGCTH